MKIEKARKIVYWTLIIPVVALFYILVTSLGGLDALYIFFIGCSPTVAISIILQSFIENETKNQTTTTERINE